jgi:hypothetical protein
VQSARPAVSTDGPGFATKFRRMGRKRSGVPVALRYQSARPICPDAHKGPRDFHSPALGGLGSSS